MFITMAMSLNWQHLQWRQQMKLMSRSQNILGGIYKNQENEVLEIDDFFEALPEPMLKRFDPENGANMLPTSLPPWRPLGAAWAPGAVLQRS